MSETAQHGDLGAAHTASTVHQCHMDQSPSSGRKLIKLRLSGFGRSMTRSVARDSGRISRDQFEIRTGKW